MAAVRAAVGQMVRVPFGIGGAPPAPPTPANPEKPDA